MDKLEHFIRVKVGGVLQVNYQAALRSDTTVSQEIIEKEENDHEYGKYSN